jgi:hypothetical protein
MADPHFGAQGEKHTSHTRHMHAFMFAFCNPVHSFHFVRVTIFQRHRPRWLFIQYQVVHVSNITKTLFMVPIKFCKIRTLHLKRENLEHLIQT